MTSPTEVDYGYEEHMPAPRSADPSDCNGYELPHISNHNNNNHAPLNSSYSSSSFIGSNRRGSTMGSPFTEEEEDDEGEPGGIDATEVSQSPSHHGCSTFTFDTMLFTETGNDYPPMPADRQARKNRSFSRRGGAVHSSLLKSAVMASMMDFDSGDDDVNIDGPRRSSNDIRRDSSISLQSLQDALRTETSPRKRARRRVRLTRSGEDTEDDDEEDDNDNVMKNSSMTPLSGSSRDLMKSSTTSNNSDDVNEASNLFDTMRMGRGITRRETIRKGESSFKREPPPRRVSRKTSYDSRVSDFDSGSSDWED